MNRSTSKSVNIEALRPELQKILSGYETVRSAYLFGSMVIGVASEIKVRIIHSILMTFKTMIVYIYGITITKYHFSMFLVTFLAGSSSK